MAYGEVITFYSYKGGVGRSMALANTATLLAQGGSRVLAMDFDLEAPGLLRYFKQVDASGADAAGVIEFFAQLEQRFEELRPRAGCGARREVDACPTAALSADLERELRASIAALTTDARYFRQVSVVNPNAPGESARLSLMPAGRYDETYPDRVRSFPWQAFYDAHPYFVEFLIDDLCARYDYVLIDSRTGTTDVGNLCTVLLPEKLVLVSTPNEQSLHGATEVGRQAVEMRKASPDLRPLPLFPLISRVENAEDALQRTWIRESQRRYEGVFRQVYGISKSLTVYFDTVQIPHKSFYSYGEVIAAERERVSEARSLGAAYREFVDALRSNNAVDAQETMTARLIPPNAAQEVASAARQQTLLLAGKVKAAEAREHDLEERLRELEVQPATHEPPISSQHRPTVLTMVRSASPGSNEPVEVAGPARSAAERKPLRGWWVASVALSAAAIGLAISLRAGTPSMVEQSSLQSTHGHAGAPPAPSAASQLPEAPSSQPSSPVAEPRIAPIPSEAPAASPSPSEPVRAPATTASAVTAPATMAPPATRDSRSWEGDTSAHPRRKSASLLPPAIPPTVDQALFEQIHTRASSQGRAGLTTRGGQPLYTFDIWIDAPGAVAQQVESVSYFFDHPSFQQKTLVSKARPDFRQSYQGWGCLEKVVITVTLANGRSAARDFNQCAAL